MNRAQRRKITRELADEFEKIRMSSAKYDDRWARIKTFELWEGRTDHKPADVLVVLGTLEHQTNVDDALLVIKNLCRVVAIFTIQLDAIRDAEAWKRIIGKHFKVISLQQEGSKIVVVASPTTQVPYAKIVAAGTEEGWWDNIVRNSATIKKRVAQASAHDVRAIIACYGPSLTANIPRLVEEALEGPSNIISVSGAHDFLIGQGIIPHYHVECDPRPHKADNINKPSHETEYLLGSLVHPVLVQKLSGYDVSLFHGSGPLNMRLKDELEPDCWITPGGSNVGLRAIGLFYEMGYRHFSMYGMDCSIREYDPEHKSAWADQWAGPHASKANPKEHQIVQARCNGLIFDTTVVMLQYAGDFWKTVEKLPDVTFRIYGEGLLQTMAQMYRANQQEAA